MQSLIFKKTRLFNAKELEMGEQYDPYINSNHHHRNR